MEDTKFSLNQTPISTILAWVESGAIAIPEIQRPFVWTSTQVRDLMDSLYQGYPVGYIITWQNPDVKLKDGSTSQGKRILIDGQQRIAALRAAISGLNVFDKKYKKRRIAISFNPLTEEFRTRTSSTERGKEWISDIAEVMVNGYDTLTFVDEYVARNPGTTRQEINSRLNRLIQIKNKQIGEIQLSPSLDINIVNEIFVRINASGVNLSNADFAMSKIAVYEKDPGDEMGMRLRKFIDYFAHLSAAPDQFKDIAQNDTEFAKTDYFAKIAWLKNETDDLYDPTYNDIIRVVGLTQFARGKLGDVVSLLSGRNFETRQDEKEIADLSFQKLEKGLHQFTNENKFKQFVQNILRGSGYDEPNMLIARNAVNYAYAMYLRLLDIGENHADANSLVRRLLAISLMTGRHSGSFETQFEQDIKRIQSAGDMAKFIATLEEQELSDVFWNSTLVDEFDKPTTNNPFWHMFIAAQNKLLKQSFLSKNNIARDLATDDIHHIFPKNYLVKHGYDKSKYNRIANFVHLRNDINISVSDLAPREYLGDILSGGNNHHSDIVNEAEMINNFEDNAIPKILLQAEVDDYDEFLRQRQVLMAEMVREYYKTL
ncbi:DUF262 domain-containing protein [Candidatus Nanosynsacchari sp. TM7_ANC_38.39_G1_1]|uniref:GmrSD restriction endonuclease domain-containing protein n=1 Tax=Candidatus Nanosynsacchari sp. TM7_ANC_38.39_G1_1 TaxID=1986206 RepID=UPI00101D8672|nr:DUF262 domain-containing protein [Candidatus Nanosynsacchari sp. TM7_ANC_38.39_G1_1]RYC74124.1 hypothetical protein G1ANC_00204 [Candidatus Nanosynsacchari sp. TM7_ANC_38.39_G1_1]